MPAIYQYFTAVIHVLFHTSRDPQRQLTSLSYNTNTACILHRSPRLVVTMILCLLLDYKTSRRLRVKKPVNEIHFVTFNTSGIRWGELSDTRYGYIGRGGRFSINMGLAQARPNE